MEITKLRIVEAADQLFNSRGFKSVTVDQIAEQLGMSKKTIYQHFSGKEEIAEAVIETAMDRLTEKFDQLGNTDDPIGELRTSLEQVKAEIVRLNPILLEDIRKLLPQLYQTMLDYRAQRIAQIEHSIRAAQAAGKTRHVDAHLVAVMFLETAQHLTNPDLLARYGFSLSEIVTTMIDMFVAGLEK